MDDECAERVDRDERHDDPLARQEPPHHLQAASSSGCCRCSSVAVALSVLHQLFVLGVTRPRHPSARVNAAAVKACAALVGMMQRAPRRCMMHAARCVLESVL
jgi:hypothetical protein